MKIMISKINFHTPYIHLMKIFAMHYVKLTIIQFCVRYKFPLAHLNKNNQND